MKKLCWIIIVFCSFLNLTPASFSATNTTTIQEEVSIPDLLLNNVFYWNVFDLYFVSYSKQNEYSGVGEVWLYWTEWDYEYEELLQHRQKFQYVRTNNIFITIDVLVKDKKTNEKILNKYNFVLGLDRKLHQAKREGDVLFSIDTEATRPSEILVPAK